MKCFGTCPINISKVFSPRLSLPKEIWKTLSAHLICWRIWLPPTESIFQSKWKFSLWMFQRPFKAESTMLSSIIRKEQASPSVLQILPLAVMQYLHGLPLQGWRNALDHLDPSFHDISIFIWIPEVLCCDWGFTLLDTVQKHNERPSQLPLHYRSTEENELCLFLFLWKE